MLLHITSPDLPLTLGCIKRLKYYLHLWHQNLQTPLMKIELVYKTKMVNNTLWNQQEAIERKNYN